MRLKKISYPGCFFSKRKISKTNFDKIYNIIKSSLAKSNERKEGKNFLRSALLPDFNKDIPETKNMAAKKLRRVQKFFWGCKIG